MITNITQWVEYIAEKVAQIKQEQVDKDILETILEERFNEKVAPLLTDADMQMIQNNAEDEKFAERYMVEKVPNYSKLLEETVAEMLAEYFTEKESA